MKPHKLFAVSDRRYRATAAQRRIHGGKTVTVFLVGYEDQDPSTWQHIEGFGPTPGERKTYAVRVFRELEAKSHETLEERNLAIRLASILGKTPRLMHDLDAPMPWSCWHVNQIIGSGETRTNAMRDALFYDRWEVVHKLCKFPETSCSSCGRSFGPGNSGFSHCQNHSGLPYRD